MLARVLLGHCKGKLGVFLGCPGCLLGCCKWLLIALLISGYLYVQRAHPHLYVILAEVPLSV